MIMVGNILAGHDQSQGEIVNVNGRKYMEYYGSASIFNKTEIKNIEGKKILVSYKGLIINTYKEMQEDLQSAISYSGGKKLEDLKKCDYVLIKGTINNGDNR